jgi:hypothetical protein
MVASTRLFRALRLHRTRERHGTLLRRRYIVRMGMVRRIDLDTVLCARREGSLSESPNARVDEPPAQAGIGEQRRPRRLDAAPVPSPAVLFCGNGKFVFGDKRGSLSLVARIWCRVTARPGGKALATEVTTRLLAESEYPHWAALVANSPDGSIYSLPEYLGALCGAAGGRFRILVAERDEKIVGGIALYERQSRAGSYVTPRLLLYYNGFVLMPHDTKYPSQRTSWQLQTLTALEQALSRLGHARLRIKSRATLSDIRVFRAQHWSVDPGYSYVVDISDLAVAWDRIDKNLRRLVSRCKEQGLTASADSDFDAFYRLHTQIHERKGAALYLPHEAFRGFIERLRAQNLCRLYHARLPDGRAIASQLVLLGPHPVTHTVCAAADADFLNLGASAFLRWHVFEDLARAGYKANDLTDAALNPVTHFKSQLGGDLTLCLEIARPDSLRWRGAELAASIPGRAKRRLLRMLQPSIARKPT